MIIDYLEFLLCWIIDPLKSPAVYEKIFLNS